MEISTFEALKANPNMKLEINGGDLMRLLEDCANQAKEATGQRKQKRYTIAEVSERLGVNRTTLWRWAKVGILVPVVNGGKRYYKGADVEAMYNGTR